MSEYLSFACELFTLVCLTCLACFAVMATITEFFDWKHEPHQRSFFEGIEDARNRLMNDAWWFSESPETQELLRDLGRGMNVNEARERWRNVRESAEAIGSE